MSAQMEALDRIFKFTEKVDTKFTVSQLTPAVQQVLVRIIDATEKYYGQMERSYNALEKEVNQLRGEISAMKAKGHSEVYTFSDEDGKEEEEELRSSIASVQRLEKQCKQLSEKNTFLTRQNQLLKTKLEQIKASNAMQGAHSTQGQSDGEHYTVHEHAAIFKDTSSVPSMANLASDGYVSDDEEQFGLMPELDFPVVQKIATLLNRFEERKYVHTTPLYQFADLFIQLAEEVRSLVAMENKVLEIRSPVYVFGDIHGNYKDLRFYLSRFNPTGRMGWLPHKLLFLGDYVDRGDHSIEVVARLFIDKICSRTKVFLLRGNHELSYVNSQVETYGQGCFRLQCQNAFKSRGDDVFWAINRAFDCLPLAAIIDHEIFCVHGGIPRPNLPPSPTPPPPSPAIRPPQTVNIQKAQSMLRQGSMLNFNFNLFGDGMGGKAGGAGGMGSNKGALMGSLAAATAASSSSQSTAAQMALESKQQALAMGASPSTAQLLSSIPSTLAPSPSKAFFHQSNESRIDAIRAFPPSLPGTLGFHESCPLLSDLLWADPAPPERILDPSGYCVGVRGPDSVMFGQPAIDSFLKNAGLTLVLRGHEDQADGMQLSLNGKCFTVFSSSNYRDSNSGACLLCNEKKIHLVIKQCNLPRAMTHSASGTRFPKLFYGSEQPEIDPKSGGIIIGDHSSDNVANSGGMGGHSMPLRPASMVGGGTLVGADGTYMPSSNSSSSSSSSSSPSSSASQSSATSSPSGTTGRLLSSTGSSRLGSAGRSTSPTSAGSSVHRKLVISTDSSSASSGPLSPSRKPETPSSRRIGSPRSSSSIFSSSSGSAGSPRRLQGS